MAAVTLPQAPQPVSTTLPVTILESHKSNFTTLVPEAVTLTSLLKYVEGFPWTITYFGQILNSSNTPTTFDPTNINLTIPYYQINDLIMQVSSPLTSSYNQATGVTTVEGTSILPYGVTPNIGDVFLANIDNGEDAVFAINGVTRKTHRKDTIYEVTYYLLFYVSVNQSFYSNLQGAVQDLYYFNKDTNFFNRDNLITPVVKEAVDTLNAFLLHSKDYYFSSFTNKGLGGLFIPNRDNKLYDPLLVNFLLQTVEMSPTYNRLSLFNYSNDEYIDQPTILTAIARRDKAYLNILNKQMAFVPARNIANRARLGTLAAAGIDYVLYPITSTDKYRIDNTRDTSIILTGAISPLTTENYTNFNIDIETITGVKPLFPPMDVNNSYIVSESFYSYVLDPNAPTSSSISYIELLIYKFIYNQAITKKDLVVAIQEYEKWDSITQYYYLPIMWLVVRCYL